MAVNAWAVQCMNVDFGGGLNLLEAVMFRRLLFSALPSARPCVSQLGQAEEWPRMERWCNDSLRWLTGEWMWTARDQWESCRDKVCSQQVGQSTEQLLRSRSGQTSLL